MRVSARIRGIALASNPRRGSLPRSIGPRGKAAQSNSLASVKAEVESREPKGRAEPQASGRTGLYTSMRPWRETVSHALGLGGPSSCEGPPEGRAFISSITRAAVC